MNPRIVDGRCMHAKSDFNIDHNLLVLDHKDYCKLALNDSYFIITQTKCITDLYFSLLYCCFLDVIYCLQVKAFSFG
jgi:hypothetical protein